MTPEVEMLQYIRCVKIEDPCRGAIHSAHAVEWQYNDFRCVMQYYAQSMRAQYIAPLQNIMTVLE